MSNFPIFSNLTKSNLLNEQELGNSKRFRTTVKRDFKLKSGLTIPKGAKVECEFPENLTSTFLVHLEDKTFKMRYENASEYLGGFTRPPNMLKLERYVNDGIASTPLGNRTEPDGRGEYNEPSWLLVMGLI